MVNDKYLYLIQLCMELQRGEDGRIERCIEWKGEKGPTIFFKFYGHIPILDIDILFMAGEMVQARRILINFILMNA